MRMWSNPQLTQGSPPSPTGQAPIAGDPTWQSQWGQLNGRLIGDTYLPSDVSTVDVGNGWYEVHHGGGRVGTLRPGGENGRFINDTNWQIPQPGLNSGGQPPPPAGPGGMAPQPQAGFASSGRYGDQAAQMAGLLAQPQMQPQMQPQPQMQQPATGLLGPPKGFRIPGGK